MSIHTVLSTQIMQHKEPLKYIIGSVLLDDELRPIALGEEEDRETERERNSERDRETELMIAAKRERKNGRKHSRRESTVLNGLCK